MHSGKGKSIAALILLAAMLLTLLPAGAVTAAPEDGAIDIKIYYSQKDINTTIAGRTIPAMVSDEQLEVSGDESFSALITPAAPTTVSSRNADERIAAYRLEPGTYFWRTFRTDGETKIQTAAGVFEVTADNATNDYYLCPIHITTANVGDTGDYHSKVRLFDLLSREVEPIWMADAGNRDMSTGETVYTGYYLCRQNGQKFSFRLEPENPDYADMDYEEVLSTGLPNALQMYRSVPVVKAGLKLKEITVKVTAGGPLLFFRKTGAHYTPFKIYPQELVASNQDGYDIYKVKLAQEAGFIAGGGDSPYVKTGGPLYYIITSPTGQTVSSLVINLQTPDEVMRTYENPYNNNLYLNINNARYLVKGADNDFNLVPLRAWQGLMYGETMANGFINPDFHAEVLNLGGADLTAVSDANPGRDSFTLASAAPGLSLVRVTYDPLQWYTYGDMQSPFIIPPNGEIVTPAWTDVYYPGIDPVHTGLFIVNTVADPAAANPANLQTNITAEEVGAYYFDQDLTDHAEYTFTPTADAGEISVRVHDPLHGASDLAAAWADEAQWTDYSPEADGAFTVNLKEGRNIVEVATSAQEFKQYYVVNAKGVTVNIANLGKPDWQKGENLSLGDTVQIVFTGVESAPTKLAGIYNPQRMDSVYDTSWGTTVRGWGSGYDVGDANYLSLTPGETGELRLFNGVLYSEGYGGTSGLHHSIGPEGFKPNLSAASVAGDYSTLPDITLFIEDGIFVAERRRDEYALLSNIYSSINGSSTNTLPLPGQAHYRNLDVPICRSVDGSEYSSTAVHLYGIKEGRVYIRNWLGSAPDDIVFARFLSHSEMTNNNALTGLSGPRRAEWDSGGDVEYAELVLAPAEDLGNPLTYTFRLITEEDYGRYPYIQDLRLNLDSRSDINYYSGRLLAVDENGDPATVDTAPESTNADSDDEKPVLSLGYGFLATRSSYISHVPYNVGSVTLSVHPFTEPNGQTTEVTVNGEPVVDEVSRPIPLSGEETVITVVGTAAAVDPVTNEKNSVEYTLKVLRDPAPVNFTVATVEGGRLSIRKPSGVRVIPNEDGTYPLPVTSGYSYIYERPGYVTVTGTFEVTAAMTAGTEITLAAPSVPVNQAAGQARVTVIAADETLFRDAAVSFDPATAPDLAGRGYLPYNPGGYTVLNALVDALESDHSLFVGLGGAGVDFTVTPVEGVLEEVAGVTLAEGESWICELGGAVIDDYAHTLVPPGADIVLYRSSGAADETLLRLTPGESSVPRGESVALTLTGRVGAGGPAAAVAGAAILIDRQPTDYVTDDAGQVTIDTSRLSLNYHTIEAALPDVPILNTSATIRVTKPADAAVTNTVSLRLIGAEPPEQEGYGPWFDYRNWIATDEYELTGESVTAADVFRAVTVRHGLETDIRFEGNYISAIQAPEEFGGEYLAESDAGGYSGWMYTVNGEYTDYGIAEQTVSPGDELVFHYSADPLREFNRHWLYVEDVNP
ncbi:MAG: DUF4430 domain-containing protein, partial [Gracilibacteraceae bacterium]|nr:DUF4430 domain-containing protein [Gracilibacteraceae bacterium]